MIEPGKIHVEVNPMRGDRNPDLFYTYTDGSRLLVSGGVYIDASLHSMNVVDLVERLEVVALPIVMFEAPASEMVTDHDIARHALAS